MQVSKRLAGTHPDKLLDNLQRHIDDGHAQSALQSIPELQQNYPQFQNELERIRDELNSNLLDDVKVLDRQQAEIFRCVQCGAGLARQNADTVHVICHYCGSDAQNPAQDRDLERWNHTIDLEANFTIGDFFNYDNKRWQSIGVQLYGGRVREYDSEDGWTTSYARYTTWWMLNEHRELSWLVDDGSRRYWVEKHLPDDPSLPADKDNDYEYGEWKLEFAAGEFTYQPLPGEQHHSAEFSRARPIGKDGDSRRYYTSVEKRLDNTGKVREIEFFKSFMLKHNDVLNALGKDTALLDVKRWRKTFKSMFVAFPLLLASMLYLDRGGDKVEESVALASGDLAVPLMQVTAEEAGQLLSFRGAASGVQSNSWFGVELSLLNSDNENVYSKYLEFWRETGVDSDGHWSEASLATRWLVRIDEPDTYRVVVDADPQSRTPTADFTFSAERNRVSKTPFILAAFLSVVLLMLSRSKVSSIRSAAAFIGLKK